MKLLLYAAGFVSLTIPFKNCNNNHFHRVTANIESIEMQDSVGNKVDTLLITASPVLVVKLRNPDSIPNGGLVFHLDYQMDTLIGFSERGVRLDPQETKTLKYTMARNLQLGYWTFLGKLYNDTMLIDQKSCHAVIVEKTNKMDEVLPVNGQVITTNPVWFSYQTTSVVKNAPINFEIRVQNGRLTLKNITVLYSVSGLSHARTLTGSKHLIQTLVPDTTIILDGFSFLIDNVETNQLGVKVTLMDNNSAVLYSEIYNFKLGDPIEKRIK